MSNCKSAKVQILGNTKILKSLLKIITISLNNFNSFQNHKIAVKAIEICG